MSENKFNIAVLIDGDNAQAKLIKEIIEEVSKYGKATIRRIYGDWTTPQMKVWKDVLNQYSINPIQKFSYTTGKNSTDSSMIIDAMDILHLQHVDGFCIVSSDSDYTGLAKRIREEGLFVMGIGKSSTPIAFVNSCEIFTFTENLITDTDLPGIIDETPNKIRKTTNQKKTKIEANTVMQPDASPITEKTKNSSNTPSKQAKINIKLIDKAFDISCNEEEEAYISTVGNALRKIDPSFDPRTYGYKTLTQLFEHIEKYTIVKNEVNGLSYPILKRKHKL
jgi:uncharacterized protein (TIGR00288 family)